MSTPAENYPIEVTFPDISAHADSESGVPYVHTFDSGLPGPHVMINALTHGNEVCGAIVVDALLRLKLRPRRGRLTLAFANVAAYASFDPSTPDAARFVDQDFNRVWRSEVLDDTSRTSSELARAREMRPVIDTVDTLLDLHSMHERSAPLIVAGPLDKGIELSLRLGTPATVICDEGHPEGRRMRDYEGFGAADSPKNALLIECGQHWEQNAVRSPAIRLRVSCCFPAWSTVKIYPPTGSLRCRRHARRARDGTGRRAAAWIFALPALTPAWKFSLRRGVSSAGRMASRSARLTTIACW